MHNQNYILDCIRAFEMSMEEIEVEEAVAAYIKEQRKDFRVTTTCSGALILPISISPPKETDVAICIGENTLFVSIYQARWIKRIDRRMLYYRALQE